jgi:hypothetical protein
MLARRDFFEARFIAMSFFARNKPDQEAELTKR